MKILKYLGVIAGITIICTACSQNNETTLKDEPQTTESQQGIIKPSPTPSTTETPQIKEGSSSIYRSNEDATGFIKEEIHYTSDLSESEVIQTLFNALKENAEEIQSFAIVPNDVELLTYKIDENILYLNFNDKATQLQGSTGEIMFVDGVNQTMFEYFKNINIIKYQVDGSDIETLSQLYVADGFERNDYLK